MPFKLLNYAVVCLIATAASAEDDISITPLPKPKAASPGKARVVRILTNRTAQIRKEAEECAGLGPGDAEFVSKSSVLYDTRTLYSLEVVGDSWCPGTAHPNSWQYGLTYDMTVGKPYNPLSLYAIGTKRRGAPVKLAVDVEPLVKKRLLSNEDADAECRTVINDLLSETGMSFGLSRRGLKIYFDAVHAVQACFQPITLPYEKISRFLNAGEAARLRWVPSNTLRLK